MIAQSQDSLCKQSCNRFEAPDSMLAIGKDKVVLKIAVINVLLNKQEPYFWGHNFYIKHVSWAQQDIQVE